MYIELGEQVVRKQVVSQFHFAWQCDTIFGPPARAAPAQQGPFGGFPRQLDLTFYSEKHKMNIKRQYGIVYFQKLFPLLQPNSSPMVVCLKDRIVI